MAEDRQAITTPAMSSLALGLTAEEGQQAVEDSLTEWVATMKGAGRFDCRGHTADACAPPKDWYADRADEADGLGTILLTNKGDTKNTIELRLTRHWKEGDAYFQKLTMKYNLTPLDWVGILGAIEQLTKAQEINLTPIMRRPQLDCPECGDNPAFPGFPGSPSSEHPGGGTAGGSRSPPGSPDGNPGYPKGSGGSVGHSPHPPNLDEWQRLQDLANGIEPGEHIQPSPFDPPGHVPAHGDHKENFKCEGRALNGYKHNCIDWKPLSIGEKWTAKIGNFFRRASDAYGKWILHHMWHDGKDPACTDTCNWYSNRECGLRTTGQSLIYVGEGLTLGPHGAAALTAFASGGVAIEFGDCVDEIRKICATDICGR